MKKILYIVLLIVPSAYSQGFDALLIASQAQFANEGGGGGYILNGTFGDSTNLILGGQWSLVSNTAYFTDAGIASNLQFLLSEEIPAGTALRFEVEMVSDGTQGRFDVDFEVAGGYSAVVGNVTYTEGTLVIDFTTPVGGAGQKLQIGASSASPSSFSFSNASLQLQP